MKDTYFNVDVGEAEMQNSLSLNVLLLRCPTLIKAVTAAGIDVVKYKPEYWNDIALSYIHLHYRLFNS